MTTTFDAIGDVPIQATFGPTSRCLTCGMSIGDQVMPGTMRGEFIEIGGIMHRRFDATHSPCACVLLTFWLPDDDWPGSRERIRCGLRARALERAYDAEQVGDLIRAASCRAAAHTYDTATDLTLLLAHVAHLAPHSP